MDEDTRLLDLDEFEEGLQLAEAVVGGSGQVLVSAGAALTEKLCQTLQRQGLEQVWVASTPQRLAADEIHQRLAQQFSQVIDQPLMPELLAMFERYHLGDGDE